MTVSDPTCGGRLVRVRVTSRDGSNIIAGRSLTVARANGDYVKLRPPEPTVNRTTLIKGPRSR